MSGFNYLGQQLVWVKIDKANAIVALHDIQLVTAGNGGVVIRFRGDGSLLMVKDITVDEIMSEMVKAFSKDTK